MKILVVGGGGREHAIIRKLKQSPQCGEIWCAPGNGGIACDAKCKNIKATDLDGMVAFAKEEGFDKIAFLFEEVGKIEKEHEERYRALLANIENDRVFQREEKKVWICTNCGKIVIAEKAPEKCPVCDHPQGYFELKVTNY